MPLPFLRLPELIQTQVLQNVSLLDLIFVSSISSKSRAIVKRSRKIIDLLRWNFGSDDDYDMELDRWDGGCGLNFRIEPRVKNVSSMRINGEVVPVHRSGDYCLNIGRSDLSDDERQKLIEQLSDLIFDIFKVKECDLEVLDFKCKEFVSRCTKKLKTLAVENGVLEPDFSDILEEFSVEELRAYCCWDQEVPVKFNGPLKVKILFCLSVDWLSEEALANLECSKVVLDTEFFNENDIKRVLRAWKTGGLKHLEEFTVEWKSPTLQDLKRVLEEFQAEQIGEVEFRIQREDETTANIDLNSCGFTMTIEK